MRNLRHCKHIYKITQNHFKISHLQWCSSDVRLWLFKHSWHICRAVVKYLKYLQHVSAFTRLNREVSVPQGLFCLSFDPELWKYFSFFTASRTKKRAALVAWQLDSLLILQWCPSSNSETIIKVWHLWENLGRALLPIENMLSIFFWLYKAQMALNSPASPYSPATPTWHPRGARSPSPQSTCRQLPPQWRLWTLAIQFQFFHTPQEWKKNPSGNERLGRPEQGLYRTFPVSLSVTTHSSSVCRTRSNSLPDGDLSAALSKTYGCRSDSMISSFRNLLEQQWRLEQAGCSRQKPAARLLCCCPHQQNCGPCPGSHPQTF